MNLPGEDKAGDGSGRFDDTEIAGFETAERTKRPAECKGSRAHEMSRYVFSLVEVRNQWSQSMLYY